MFKTESDNIKSNSNKRSLTQISNNKKNEEKINQNIIRHLNEIKQFMNPNKNELYERLSQHKIVKIRERNTIGGTRKNFFKNNRLTHILKEHLKEKIFFPNNTGKIMNSKTRHKTVFHKTKPQKMSTLIPKLNFNVDKNYLSKNIQQKNSLENLKLLLSSEKLEADKIKETKIIKNECPKLQEEIEESKTLKLNKGDSFSTVHINIINKDTPITSKNGFSRQNSETNISKKKENELKVIDASYNKFRNKELSATLVFSANKNNPQVKGASKILETLFDLKSKKIKNRCSINTKSSYNKIFKKPFKSKSENKKKFRVHSQM
jgi:hypothetical protein